MNECVLLTSSGRGKRGASWFASPRKSLYWTRVRFDGSNHPLFSRKCPLVTTGYSDTCGHACMLCACFLGATLPNCSTRSAKMKQNLKTPFPVVGNLRGFSDFPRRCVKTRFELMWRGPGKRFLYSPGPPRGAATTGVYRPSPPCGSRGPQRLSLPEDAVYPPPAGLPPPPGAAGVAGVDLPEEGVNQSRRRLSGALVVVVQHLSIESAAGEEKKRGGVFFGENWPPRKGERSIAAAEDVVFVRSCHPARIDGPCDERFPSCLCLLCTCLKVLSLRVSEWTTYFLLSSCVEVLRVLECSLQEFRDAPATFFPPMYVCQSPLRLSEWTGQ